MNSSSCSAEWELSRRYPSLGPTASIWYCPPRSSRCYGMWLRRCRTGRPSPLLQCTSALRRRKRLTCSGSVDRRLSNSWSPARLRLSSLVGTVECGSLPCLPTGNGGLHSGVSLWIEWSRLPARAGCTNRPLRPDALAEARWCRSRSFWTRVCCTQRTCATRFCGSPSRTSTRPCGRRTSSKNSIGTSSMLASAARRIFTLRRGCLAAHLPKWLSCI